VFDVLLLGGRVVDGSHGKAMRADVGVSGGKIEAVGNLASCQAARTIDVSALTVAPGFIDSHSHSDINLLIDPRALSSLRQGVTTEVIGNCGASCAPIFGNTLKQLAGLAPISADRITWRSFGEYLDRLRAGRPSINVVPKVGHRALRVAIPGLGEKPASEDQLGLMKGLLRDCLCEGARGLSTGLEYSPGSEADLNELRALVSELGDGLYSTHIRSRNPDDHAAAVDEALATIDGFPAHLQISHLGPRANMRSEEFERMLERINQANEAGGDVAFEVLMYDYGPHSLDDLLPGWVQQRSPEQVAALAATPEVIGEMRENSRSSLHFLLSTGRAHMMNVVRARHTPQWVGMNFQQIAEKVGKDPFEVAGQMLATAGPDYNDIGLLTPYTSEANIRRMLLEPSCMPACDGAAVCTDGPFAGSPAWTNSYGWAARFLEEYVGRLQILSLEEGIRRLTSLPARCARLRDRGLVREGYAADLVVFDPALVSDRSLRPQGPDYASGVVHVLVNGQLAVEDGRETGVRAGRVL
jgi:N-acyl-D-amino-acid deacylase